MSEIVERNDRVGNTNLYRTLGLYLEEKRVVFRAGLSSPEPNDVSYSYYYEFDAEDYEKGILELRKGGRCTLTSRRLLGRDGDGKERWLEEELIVLAGPSGEAVGFDIPVSENETSGLYPHSFPTEWTVDQISLPGTPPSCQAKAVVPNVYEGKRWG